MSQWEPRAGSAYQESASGALVPWEVARERWAGAEWYWVGTVRGDCGPHVVPVLGVWADGALHFAAGDATRKARNLAREPRCVITTQAEGLHLVAEGEAWRVTAEEALHAASRAYGEKYGWPTEVAGGALEAEEGAPSAGPPPYGVYRVRPARAFAFPFAEGYAPTRWRFNGA